MKKEIVFACPMDCFDTCSLVAIVENDQIVNIKGNKDHPITQGLVCLKGKKLLEKLYHPKRLKAPQKKINDKWVTIQWDDALNEIAMNLQSIKKKYGQQAILHYFYDGYTGLIKSVDQMFFNYYGGASHMSARHSHVRVVRHSHIL